MAKYSKLETLQTMKETGIVPVFYHGDLTVAKNVLKACYDGGIRASSSPTAAISRRKSSASWLNTPTKSFPA